MQSPTSSSDQKTDTATDGASGDTSLIEGNASDTSSSAEAENQNTEGESAGSDTETESENAAEPTQKPQKAGN